MTLPTIPPWLPLFLDGLGAENLPAATRRGYRYDLLRFVAWYTAQQGTAPDLPRLTEQDIIAWRQHRLVQEMARAPPVNRRLTAVCRLLRWAKATGTVPGNIASAVRAVRLTRDRHPVGLTAAEVHALLRVPVPIPMAWPGATAPWSDSGRRPACALAKWRAHPAPTHRDETTRRHREGLTENEVPHSATARRGRCATSSPSINV
jgi:integrase